MSLEELTSTHSAARHPLTLAQDDMGGDKETLGDKETDLNCRFIPISRKVRASYGVTDEREMYKVLFSADPSLTDAKALVWNSKVWRVREVIDSGGVGMVWHAIVEHVPQVELASS